MERNLWQKEIWPALGAATLFTWGIGIPLWAYGSAVRIEGVPIYEWLLQEDGPAETLTAVCLLLGCVFSVYAFVKVSGPARRASWFLVAFGVFLLLMALEEISWGQRIFGVEPGEFFQRYNGQGETNFHNTMQLYLKGQGFPLFKTRHIAALLLVTYGVLLPALNRIAKVRDLLTSAGVVVPAPILSIGFLSGALLAWFDWPTGQEEELGELLLAMALMLVVPFWWCGRDAC